MGPVVDGFLARHGLARADLDGYACHPGGAKVTAALEEVFGVPDGGFTAARGVLRDFGNMSAVTVLFVLERLRRKGMKGRYLMTGMGRTEERWGGKECGRTCSSRGAAYHYTKNKEAMENA